MWWDKIIEWFSNQKERRELMNEFNKNAKIAFINNIVPVYLKAEQSRGNSAYKHQFSNFLFHGFRIKTLSGRSLTQQEIIYLGSLIVSNVGLTRRLVVAGFDTVEIINPYGQIVQDWRLTALLELN